MGAFDLIPPEQHPDHGVWVSDVFDALRVRPEQLCFVVVDDPIELDRRRRVLEQMFEHAGITGQVSVETDMDRLVICAEDGFVPTWPQL
jgi:hypothetical protein